jgi:hypothetical protein
MCHSNVMGELPPKGVDHALHRRSIKLQFLESREANLEQRRVEEGGELRIAVFRLFDSLGGIEEGINWAIFQVPRKSSWNSEYEEGTEREILVVVDYRDTSSFADIRIITNEPFKRGEDRMQFLTEDFTLDHEHDAQFYVDAIELIEGGGIESRDSHSIIFGVDIDEYEDGDEVTLIASNYADYTQTHSIRAKKPRQEISPFGNPGDELDQLDALASARSLLAEIAQGELTHHGVQWEID